MYEFRNISKPPTAKKESSYPTTFFV